MLKLIFIPLLIPVFLYLVYYFSDKNKKTGRGIFRFLSILSWLIASIVIIYVFISIKNLIK